MAWLLGGIIILMVALLLGGGFILGASALFVCTTKAFGQPIFSRTLVYGLVLAVLIYLFFSQLLSLILPSGPLEVFLTSLLSQ